MSEWKAKRFWKEAQVTEDGDSYSVMLDGRPVRTPAKAPLRLPRREMAEAIAAEWDAQDKEIDPLSMPFTRSANAAIDKVAPQRSEVADMVAGYGETDLLCYRAEAPEALVRRQAEHWDPALDWAAQSYDARLRVHTGILPGPQDDSALSRLSAAVQGMNDFQLAGLHDLVSLSGSLVLGLAAAAGWRDPDTIWTLSRLDELWQEEQWGRDDEAHEMAEAKRRAFVHAKRFFDCA